MRSKDDTKHWEARACPGAKEDVADSIMAAAAGSAACEKAKAGSKRK